MVRLARPHRGGTLRVLAMELDRILRKPELLRITGVSIATIYRWIGDGHFPAPVKLGPNSSGWRESDVRAWLESREPVDVAGPDREEEPPAQEAT